MEKEISTRPTVLPKWTQITKSVCVSYDEKKGISYRFDLKRNQVLAIRRITETTLISTPNVWLLNDQEKAALKSSPRSRNAKKLKALFVSP